MNREGHDIQAIQMGCLLYFGIIYIVNAVNNPKQSVGLNIAE